MATGRREHRRRVSATFGPLLAELGFAERRNHLFVRESDECLQWLAFADSASPDGTYLFTFTVALRFESVESILCPENTYRYTATIGEPISSLVPENKYLEWPMSIKEGFDVVAVQTDVMHYVHCYALPYLEKHAMLSAVRESLESRFPPGWQGGDIANHLVETLAAVYVVEQRLDDALRIVDLQIEQTRKWPPSRLSHLRQYRDRLAQFGVPRR